MLSQLSHICCTYFSCKEAKGAQMKRFNTLFESSEITQSKIMQIEKDNIISLQKSNEEIKALLKQIHKTKHRVIYVHDTQPTKLSEMFKSIKTRRTIK